jgi:ATP-dependent Clp protease ATP-binding subunit ClpC
VTLEFDKSLIDHLAEVGYDAEFGARLLKRKVRAEVESRLATALLKGDLSPGDRVTLAYDPAQKAVRLDKRAEEKIAA